MKFICEACGGQPRSLSAFRVEKGALVVTCATCGQETSASSARSATAASEGEATQQAAGAGAVQASGAAAGGSPTSAAGATPSAYAGSLTTSGEWAMPPVSSASAHPIPAESSSSASSTTARGPESPPESASTSGALPTPSAPAPSAGSDPAQDTPATASAGGPAGASPGPGSPPPKLRVIPFRSGPDPARLAAEAARTNPFQPPPMHCPKCIAPRSEEGQACSQCGLIYINFDAASVLPSEALSEQWRATLRNWNEWSMHERFLSQATARGELAAVGRLYRIRLAVSPMDPIATRGRDEVLRLAALPPVLARTPFTSAPVGPPTWQYVMLGVFVLFALGALLMLGRQLWSATP